MVKTVSVKEQGVLFAFHNRIPMLNVYRLLHVWCISNVSSFLMLQRRSLSDFTFIFIDFQKNFLLIIFMYSSLMLGKWPSAVKYRSSEYLMLKLSSNPALAAAF